MSHDPHRQPTRRRLAACTCAALLCSIGVGAGPVQAYDSPVPGTAVPGTAVPGTAIPGDALPVPAVDVTRTDANLASAAREVVVSVDTPAGPQLTKLRTSSAAAAQSLADILDSQPGVAAHANEVIRVSQTGPDAGPDRSGAAVAVRGSGNRATSSGLVAALAAEPLGTRQWGLSAVGAESAWPITRGGGVTVAVIDTGVDASHPDLAGRILTQIDLVGDGMAGDPVGHGTHVSGIIAAALDGEGVAGLADQVQVLPVRALNASGAGDIFTVASGINRAVAAGAQVINLSLGGNSGNAVLRAAVDNARRHGVTVVAAVGNSFADGNPVEYPAGFPGVIGVSSINEKGESSDFANSGAQVDISAPGEKILSTVPGGQWDAWDGTSMATPFVSAAAALVRVANPSLTEVQVARTLTATAADDSAGNGRDNNFGYGLLRADRAVAAAAGQPYGLAAPSATVRLKATSGKSKLRVDVNPNRATGFWAFQVQRRADDGSWTTLPRVHRTRGRAQTRTVNLPQGSYRVVVVAKYGYRQTTSRTVWLQR